MDINSLRERAFTDSMTVTELNAYIKNLFRTNRTLSAITVKGEISNFTCHYSGHLYFSLKDDSSQLRAVMFRSSAQKLKFMPEEGMKVTVHGYVDVYQKDGSYQLYAQNIQPDGVGALYLAYEQLKAKLEAEGLFDRMHKQTIPRIPARIGVITSPTGAVIRDIINVVSRRFPLADIYLYPALVQGDQAESSLIEGVDYFDRSALCDVVIIGRGGGSIEDLWPFNSEALARRIYSATVPIISAVGHETDFTICDFVSDLRAPTPSAAAELAVPDARDLSLNIDTIYDRCENAINRKLSDLRARVSDFSSENIVGSLKTYFSDHRNNIKDLEQRILRSTCDKITEAKNSLTVNAQKLEALSPISVLARGYSVVKSKDHTVTFGNELSIGDDVELVFTDGTRHAQITK